MPLPMPFVTPLTSSVKGGVDIIKSDGKPARGRAPKNTVVYEIPKPAPRESAGRLTAVERRKLSRLEANERILAMLESKPKKSTIQKWFAQRVVELAD